MIGRVRVGIAQAAAHRAALTALAGVLVLGGLFAQRSPDPFAADPASLAAARATLSTALAQASARVSDVGAAIDAAIAEGRRGAALTVAGDGDPGPHLSAAADALAGGDALVVRARRALDAVAGQLAILRPGATPPALDIAAGRLAGVAGQLAASAAPADAFRDMRRASQATLTHLGAALAALDGGDVAAALTALDAADREHAAVAAWPGQLATLPIWLDTTASLLDAVRRIAVATRDGDPEAAAAAGKDYETAAGKARQADTALAIAVSEGGGGVSGTPLAALADLRQATNETLAQLAAIGPGSG